MKHQNVPEKHATHEISFYTCNFLKIQMPEYTAISAATAFMAQVKDIGDWKPINLKYAAIVHFKKMLESPQVC